MIEHHQIQFQRWCSKFQPSFIYNFIKFHQIYAGTNYYKFSFFPMLVPLWNALPSKVVLAADLEDFKESLSQVHVKSIYPN